MSEKKSDIVDYKIPIWLKPTLSIAEAAIYSGISSGKLYQMTEQEDCPFVIWIRVFWYPCWMMNRRRI